MPSRHSSVVGGSSAARIINCPGSPLMLAKLPEITDRDSFFSIEGTVCHTIMEKLITGKFKIDKLPVAIIEKGTEIRITPELIHDAIQPAWDYWQDLLTKIDTWQIETEVEFPGIKGAFGTADVLGRDDRDNITYVTDWKFGSGEAVKAVYPDGDDLFAEIVNEQLMFYACGARHTQPEFFPAGCRVILTIVQPRARGQEPITWCEVTLEEMDEFEKVLQYAIKMKDAPTKKGRWCRFQPCATICPHHTGPLLDLSALHNTPAIIEKKPDDLVYISTLLQILDAAPMAEALIREARAQAHIILGNGGAIPGWKLVAKRGTRQWAVDAKAIAKAVRLKEKDLYDTTLKSPAQVEKILPTRGKLPEGLATTVSSGTTIAPETDKRPAVSGDPNALSKILLEVLGDEA
jgi:Protein of unknown function (DUF2800)